MIDANEYRAVSMLEIEKDFMHVENDEYMLMLLCGKLAELLAKVDPKLYIKYGITSKQGVPYYMSK